MLSLGARGGDDTGGLHGGARRLVAQRYGRGAAVERRSAQKKGPRRRRDRLLLLREGRHEPHPLRSQARRISSPLVDRSPEVWMLHELRADRWHLRRVSGLCRAPGQRDDRRRRSRRDGLPPGGVHVDGVPRPGHRASSASRMGSWHRSRPSSPRVGALGGRRPNRRRRSTEAPSTSSSRPKTTAAPITIIATSATWIGQEAPSTATTAASASWASTTTAQS